MTYRDNDVFISMIDNYKLIKGSFIISDFSVTPGQDPEGKIYKGLTMNFGSDGKMTFSIGRKGSDIVANAFNNWAPQLNNTFGHHAEKLNFAFNGTLSLTISGGIIDHDSDTFLFEDIAIAQGHKGASNNWWFGGKNCINTGKDQVNCISVNQKNKPIPFIFNRGRSNSNIAAVNLIEVEL